MSGIIKCGLCGAIISMSFGKQRGHFPTCQNYTEDGRATPAQSGLGSVQTISNRIAAGRHGDAAEKISDFVEETCKGMPVAAVIGILEIVKLELIKAVGDRE